MLKKLTIPIKDFEYELLTNVGWKPIDYVHKTEKDRKYIVLFESGIEIECADKHAFISIDDTEIITKYLKAGDKIISKEGYDVVFDVFKTDEYVHFYDTTLSDHYKYFTNGILSHNTTLLINMMERMSANSHNVILFSMETSENEIAKRLDSIGTLSDINRMYTSKENVKELGGKLLKKRGGKGKIIVKEFPTGQASIADFRTVLREFQYRDIKFDAVFCDYMTIMKPEGKSVGQLYQDGKQISEELRALSLEFHVPLISVSQLNREGINIDFKEIDYTHIGESIGISAAADFMAIMGKDDESLVYKSELHYKIVKNRFGGRVQEVGKFYVDKKCLKIYDESELDLWIADSKSTGDDREVNQKY